MDEDRVGVKTECVTILLDPLEKNILLERYEFYRRCQKNEETYYTFLDDVRNLAENCDFHSEEREFLIRDRFVCGLIDKDLQTSIITSGGNPSVHKVLEFCHKYSDVIKIEELDVEIEDRVSISDDRNEEYVDRTPVDFVDDNIQGDSQSTSKQVADVKCKPNRKRKRMRPPPKIETDSTDKSNSDKIPGYSCPICKKMFKDIRYFQGHLVTHTINNDTTKASHSKETLQMIEFNFKCPTCAKEFTNLRYFKGHLVEHTIDGDLNYGDKFDCYFCKKTYESHDNLVLHYACHVNEHKTLPRVTCKTCGKVSAIGSLRKHMIQHVNNTLFQIGCDQCDKKFKTYAQLNRHKKIHEEYQKLVCDICGKEFLRRLYLDVHKKRVHPQIDSGIKDLECFICKKRLKSLPTLKVHIYWHSLPKNHMCTQCGERFRVESLLKRHLMRADHMGENLKKFKCDICNIRFYDKTQQVKHAVVHSDEKPYQCTYDNCDKRYRTKPSLKAHICTHTGERPYECQLCGYKFTTNKSMKRHMQGCVGQSK